MLFDPSITHATTIISRVQSLGYSASLLREEDGLGDSSIEDYHLSITGMSCAACSGKIERIVGAMPGVVSCSVGLSTSSAKVKIKQQYDHHVVAGSNGLSTSVGVRDVIDKITELGYGAKVVTGSNEIGSIEESHTKDTQQWR